MKYQTYAKYKSSDDMWIGDIPTDWGVKRLKFIKRLQGGYAFKSDNFKEVGIPILRIGDIKDEINYDNCKRISSSVKVPKEFIANKGDVLIALTGATIGKIGVIKKDNGKAFINQRVAKIPSKSTYYYYLMKSDLIKKQIELIGTGSAQENISNGQIEDFVIPFNDKQEKIANFLDQITKQIDDLIKKDKQLIGLLKERRISLINKAVTKGIDDKANLVDSGIDWIGKIAKGWEVRKLKHISRQIIDGTHFTPEYIENGIPFLRVTDIHKNKINLDNVKFISKEESILLNIRCNPKKGDLLLSKNGTIGIPKIVDWDYKFSIFVSLCLIKVKKQMDVNFLKYFFLSNVIKEQIFYRSKTTSVTNLHLDQIREFDITVPKFEEQKSIIKFLDFNTKKIDNHLARVKKRIKLLEEYKKSIIYSAVTGKIKV